MGRVSQGDFFVGIRALSVVRLKVFSGPTQLKTTQKRSSSLQTPPLITLFNSTYGRQPHFRQMDIMEHIRVAFAVFWSDHCDVINHVPFDTVSATFQSADSLTFKYGSAPVPE
jgi:hypothetical protein